MRILFALGLTCAACMMVQCKTGEINYGSEVKNATEGDGVPQVNPKAFNAYNIWGDGNGTEILDYPQGYEVPSGRTNPDGVFYVHQNMFRGGAYNDFIATPTDGAKVVNNVLEYPVRNGRQLKLKFTQISENGMSHDLAVAYCKDQKQRLPTIRELFDFCAAGVVEPNYGDSFRKGKYPSTARCGESFLWSASLNSNRLSEGWRFIRDEGIVDFVYRSGPYVVPFKVRCVGSE
ncbi:MAG: hypothetical protein WCI18_17260 [Pseudomonadota bacterium]